MENFPAFADYLLALVFGLLIPFVSGIRSARALRQEDIVLDATQKKKFYYGNSLFLFIAGMLVLLVWGLYHRPPGVLGLQAPVWKNKWLILSLTLTFAGLYFMDFLSSLLDQAQQEEKLREWQKQTLFLPVHWNEIPAYTVMCLSAGVFEEVIYRGFLVTFFKFQFSGLPGAGLLTVLTPAILFSIAHYYQGLAAVLKITVLSLIFGMLFVHTDSLVLVVLLHFLLDFISGLVGMYLHRHARR